MQFKESSAQHPKCDLDALPPICCGIYPANNKTQYTMSVKSLSEIDLKRGGVALRARLKYIDDRLIWFGFLRLADHASKFGISDVQGKIDLQTYRNLSATPPPDKNPGPAGSVQPGQKGPGIYERPVE